MKQLVSIIVPAYNSEKWIGACIESALAQSYQPKEVIVVDDGSTDSTFEIARSLSTSIVKLVTQENRGASAARNRGRELAQGDYLQWLDADDLLDADKIKNQMKAVVAGQPSTVLLSGSWGRFYKDPEKIRYKPDLLWEDLGPNEWLLRKIENNLWVPPMVFLVSRRLTELAGKWNENMSLDDDGEYFARVISHASQIRFISPAHCLKRSTFGLSHSANITDKKLDSLAYSIFTYVRLITSDDESERVRNAVLAFLNRWAIYFYPQRNDIIDQMQDIARGLGGKIERPTLRKKYRWMQKIFGWQIAKQAQFTLPVARHFLLSGLERFLPKLSETYENK
jgi:glycosyltransferase involved in cell wall biosynthesis